MPFLANKPARFQDAILMLSGAEKSTSRNSDSGPLRLAIAGLGAIGLEVAARIDAGAVDGIRLAAVSAHDREKAAAKLNDFSTVPDVVALNELVERADVIVECVPASLFLDVARPAIERGRIFIPLSVGVLLDHLDLVEQARQTGARIIVPTGALLGLDAVKAVAEGDVEAIRMVTRKPPAGLKGAPYLVQQGISVDGLDEAKKVFAGSAREAARGFPANVNVAAALALAGIGPERTQVEIWADPAVTRNTHTILVEADASNFTMTIENVPTQENPPTGKITALSVIATLRRLTEPLVVGT
jgi:aspartate dehydrogenase